MKILNLKKPKVKRDDWPATLMTDQHYDTLIEGDHKVYGPDGELLVVLLKNPFNKTMLANSWQILKNVNLKTDNRGTAAGTDDSVTSGVIGYYPRYPRIPYCRECAWNAENPDKFNKLLPLFLEVDNLHRLHAPESYHSQLDIVNKTNPDFVIPGTIYTTVTVNKNFRTACHLDAKNFEAGMAPMILMRQGKYEGGYVVLPEWRIAAKMDTGDLIFFRNMLDYHGNTKIVPLSKDYQRCTLVFYYRDDMQKCGTKEQELERAKSGKDFSKDFNEDKK